MRGKTPGDLRIDSGKCWATCEARCGLAKTNSRQDGRLAADPSTQMEGQLAKQDADIVPQYTRRLTHRGLLARKKGQAAADDVLLHCVDCVRAALSWFAVVEFCFRVQL